MMTALTWLPTTQMPEIGHLWITDTTTACRCTGTPTSTHQMTGRCLGCIQAYGQDVADAFPHVQWRTRGAAPFRHAFWPDDLDHAHARPVCGYLPLATRLLYASDRATRCLRCVEYLRHRLDRDRG